MEGLLEGYLHQNFDFWECSLTNTIEHFTKQESFLPFVETKCGRLPLISAVSQILTIRVRILRNFANLVDLRESIRNLVFRYLLGVGLINGCVLCVQLYGIDVTHTINAANINTESS